MKKRFFGVIISALIISSTILSGCGCNAHNTATADEASVSSMEAMNYNNTDKTEPTLSDTEQAIVDEGLKIDDKGKVVDSNGKEVKTTSDGKVEVKTADGKTVMVDTNKIKSANKNNSNNSSSLGNGSTANKTNNNNSSTNKKPVNNSSSNAVSSKPNNSTQTNKKPASSSSKPNSKPNNSQSSVDDSHAGKTYHEAVYKTVNHPAETKEVKVVDKEAYTYEEPVYETQNGYVCKRCGLDITDNLEHIFDCNSSYKTYSKKIQIGTKTVTAPEEYHYETVIVKDAWTEKVLVKEAGWY